MPSINHKPRPKPLEPVLKQLGAGGGLSGVEGEHLTISGISYDSRKVERGDAFFCVEGQNKDGNLFINDAVASGAVCIVSEKPDTSLAHPIPYIEVPDVRLALAAASNYFFDQPTRSLRLLGVTGTNGKTTVTHLVEHVLLESGHQAGLIGTLGARWEDSSVPSANRLYHDIKFTTPQASDLQELLFKMATDGVSHVAMEVSSHALALKRVAGSHFAVACLTNITQDHLDFHKTMNHYWRSKRLLFEQLNDSIQAGKTAVINADDPLSEEFEAAVDQRNVQVLTYGFGDKASVSAGGAHFDFSGAAFAVRTPAGEVDLKLKLNGRFNVYNSLAALAICLSEGIKLDVIKQALENFSGVPGRFEIVGRPTPEQDTRELNTLGQGERQGSASPAEPLCIVDYAHTPDGLKNVLKAARALVPSDGRLVVVFGCGGDRDSSKRSQMGGIAEAYADNVVVTSDNPRTEEPRQIIVDVLAGIKRMKGVRVEPDRAAAIHAAIEEANSRDVVVVAGKGHETYQILKDTTIAFDDRMEVLKALSQRASR